MYSYISLLLKCIVRKYFYCLVKISLLVDVDAVAALPGLGEVGGLLTVLLASLKSPDQESVGHSYTQQRKRL